MQKDCLTRHSQGFGQRATKKTIIPGSKYPLKKTSSKSDAADKLIEKILAKKKIQKTMYFTWCLAHYKYSWKGNNLCV